MSQVESGRRVVGRGAVAAVLAALVGVSAAACTGGRGASAAAQQTIVAPSEGGTVIGSDRWKEIDRLVGEQKLEEASRVAAELRAAAQGAGDAAGWTRGLVSETQLRIGLHGYETAVRFLKEQPWPADARSQAVLDLFFARSLTTYLQAYSWEINRREQVESRAEVDLKAWTREEIVARAVASFGRVWEGREALGRQPVAELAEYLEANTYPRGVRGTLRDAVTYLFVELLGDTSHWSPEESNELYRLPLAALLSGHTGQVEAGALNDASVHPLMKVCALLDDLEGWHRGAGRREAALEAFLERVRRLGASFDEGADREQVRAALAARLDGERRVAWWSMGTALLAELTRDGGGSGALVRARELALAGAAAYPDSVGAQRCRAIAGEIEQPDYSIAVMASDGAGRRSLAVTHKNLARLELRAFAVDLVKRVETAKDYNLLPAWREVESIVRDQAPVASWTVELPATPDFESHRTFVTPPLTAPGLYVIAASGGSGLARGEGRRMAVNFVLTDLVLLTRRDGDGSATVTVVSGASGKPVPGARVSLYRFDWQQGHHAVATVTAGETGEARFPYSRTLGGAPHFVLAQHGADLAVDPDGLWLSAQERERDGTSALLFTDRSVYRPLQTLLWKAIVYRGGKDARYRVLPATGFNVTLLDGNGEEVATSTVTSNDFGSAAGEFAIPAGRVLGSWRLRASAGGEAEFRVEEYKRPTFEASFREPAASSKSRYTGTSTW